MADLRTNIAALLLADFKAEAGFPAVQRIPTSTEAVKFLDYFAALNSAEVAALLDALARGHALQFFPPSAVHQEGLELSDSNSALVPFRDAARTGQFAYAGISVPRTPFCGNINLRGPMTITKYIVARTAKEASRF